MIFRIAASFLLLSGIASLTYQVTWVRLLGLSMGSTSASISTVLAAFFLGLALGSYLAERITRNRINSLRIYIVLEVIIGAAGLLLLPILLHLDNFVASFPVLGSSLSMKFVVAMVLLTVPTLCMGATFPVMASILVRRQREVGLRMSQLYSLNTAGAVLGAAMAGFVFIPHWGLNGAVYIAFTINVLIVVCGVLVNRKLTLPAIETEVPATDRPISNLATEAAAPLRKRALLVLFATGFVSIATEVGWTKYLSIFTGTTIYGFAAILTVFLIGIASGSWVIRSVVERMQRPERWMALGLIVLGTLLLLTRAGLSLVPPVYHAINHLPAPTPIIHGVKYTFVFLLLFPPTFVFGLLFPINLKLYCGDLRGVRAHIGKAYAVNTVASIFGSVLAGFWIIPRFGTDVLLSAMGLIILLLPIVFLPALRPLQLRSMVALIMLLIMASNWVLPHISYRNLISSVQYKFDNDAKANKKPKFLFLKEGKAGVISMVTYNGHTVKLQNNGLNESIIDLKNSKNVLLVETLLGLLPYFLHDNPQSAFVVGFGGGITTRALTMTKLKSIKVVELEPAVVEAGRAITKNHKIAALQDPRVTLEYNDARNSLLIEPQKYDIIAAQPSHPWLARASNVFTQEFFEIVKSRLNKGGIYSQWVNLFNMDATTLRSILKAFFNVFPHGMTFADTRTGDLIMIGSVHQLVFNYEQIARRMQAPRIKQALSWHDIHQPRDLLWYFSLSRKEAVAAAGNIAPNTDTNILSEVQLSALDGEGKGVENPYRFIRDHYHLDIVPYLDKDIPQRLYSLADYFFGWNELGLALKAGIQLNAFDPELARSIEYEALWREYDFEAAFALFAKYPQWPDRTYQLQAQALSLEKRFAEAAAVVKNIDNTVLRRIAYAQLLYAQQDWTHLKNLKPQSNEERKWQLTGLAQSNISIAGKGIEALLNSVEMKIPQLRVLVRYYAYRNDKTKLEKYSRKLIKAIDTKAKRLSNIADVELKNGDRLRVRRLLNQIKILNPAWKRLPDLQRRFDALFPAKLPVKNSASSNKS